jgi:epoxyqueuosine reductase
MDQAELKSAIIEYASGIGISKIGFANTEPLTELQAVLELRLAEGYQSDFEEEKTALRIAPRAMLPNASTVISVALAYPSMLPDSEFVSGEKRNQESLRGVVSRSAWGCDYHLILGKKLKRLADYISELLPDSESLYYVDRTGLMEKALAQRAGIGWVGKNSLLITPEYGSYVFLGELLTTMKLDQDEPISEQCGACRICIDACPNQAILDNRVINAQRCLSELTQKKELVEQHYEALGLRVYGCDTCQEACPKNRGIAQEISPEIVTSDFLPLADQARPILLDVVRMNNRVFDEQWRNTAAGWRGKKTLQRNAIIALGNVQAGAAVDELEKLTMDEREEIRRAASWAKKRLTK